MKSKTIFTFTSIIVLLTFVACNIPASTSPESAVDIQTAAALTVEAAINSSNQTPLASPTSSAQNNNSNSTAQPTDSSGEPFASFEDVTNCRMGPGVNYQRVTQIVPNESVKIVGFYPPNYWIVSTSAGECWVSGEFVTPSGSLAAVPTVTAPATPQGGSPDDVSLQSWNISCNYATNEANVTIAWSDKDGETGYRVFRNNELAIELPANSTSFGETITLLAGQSVGYYIVAFNGAGETSSKSITLTC